MKQNDGNKIARHLVLLYGGTKGEERIRSMKNDLKFVFAENARISVFRELN